MGQIAAPAHVFVTLFLPSGRFSKIPAAKLTVFTPDRGILPEAFPSIPRRKGNRLGMTGYRGNGSLWDAVRIAYIMSDKTDVSFLTGGLKKWN